MRTPRAVYAIQYFKDDKWETVDISSYRPDIEKSFQTLQELVKCSGPESRLIKTQFRLARFTVDDLNCIALHTRDFAVESKINF